MIANLNTEQAAAAAHLLTTYPGPAVIEGGPGGVRYLTIRADDGERVRYELALDGDIQGAMPAPEPGPLTRRLGPGMDAHERSKRGG